MRTDVQIVIPSHGRPAQLAVCLEVLQRLDGGPYRTIVVDDGSPESLEAVCAAAGPHVTCIRQDQAGPAAARNTGVAAAKDADILLFTDDDCHPRPGWAEALVRAQGSTPMRLVGGRVENGLPGNPYSAASQGILSYSYDAFGGFGDPLAFFTTNNIAARAVDIASVGFDPGYRFAAEDRDFSRRWRAAGGTLLYARDAVVDHRHPLTLRRFWRQHLSYGRGARRFHESLASAEGPPLKWGAPRFYAGLLLHPLRRPGPAALRQTALIGIAHLALFLGYLDERRTQGARNAHSGKRARN